MDPEDPFITGLRRYFAARKDVRPATVSAAANLNKSAIRKMIDGQVTSPRHKSMAAIAAVLDLSVDDIIAQRFDGGGDASRRPETAQPPAEPLHELAEQVRPYVARPFDKGETLEAYLAPKTRHRATFAATTAAPWLGVMAGDVLVIDMRNPPRPGDIILAAIIDGDTAETRILRYMPPYLLTGDPTAPPIPESAARIQGPIVALARGPGL